jgi:hypothetical protein
MNHFLPTKDVVLDTVKRDGMFLEFINPDKFKEDYKQMVETAVNTDGMALQFAKEYKDDEEIVYSAVSQNGMALQFASDNLKNNIRIVRKATDQNPNSMEFASVEAYRYLHSINILEMDVNSVWNGSYPHNNSLRFPRMSQSNHKKHNKKYKSFRQGSKSKRKNKNKSKRQPKRMSKKKKKRTKRK